MTEATTNPGQRLLDVLQPLVRAGRGSKSSEPLGVALGKLYGLSYPTDMAELLRKLALILSLPSEYRRAVESLDDAPGSEFLEQFGNVEQAFSKFALQGHCSHMVNHLDDATLKEVKLATALLRTRMPEPALSVEDEARLEELLQEMEAASPDLSPAAQEILQRHLAKLRVAIVDSRIIGLQAVREATFTMMGEYMAHPPEAAELSTTRRFINNLLLFLTVIYGTAQAAEQVLEVPLKYRELTAEVSPAKDAASPAAKQAPGPKKP